MNVERYGRRDAGRLDGWHRSELFEQPRGKRPGIGRSGVAAGKIVGGQEHAFTAESRIRAARLEEASQKQSRHDQHQQRQRDLDPHERVSQPASPRRLRTGSKDHVRIETGELHRRCGTEDQPASRTQHQRKREAPGIDARLKADRQSGERQQLKCLCAPDRDWKSQHGAGEREDDVLRQEQADNPAWRRSEGEAHRNLPLARAGAGEHEVGRIAADGQQQEQHQALQNRERGREQPLRAPRRLPERKHFAPHRRVRLWIGLRKLTHGGVELGLRLLPRGGRLKPAHCRVASDPAVLELARPVEHDRRQRRRQPDVEVQPEHGALERSRGDADDGEVAAVHSQRPSGRIRCAIEPRLPQAVPDHGDRLAARRRRLSRFEKAAQRRPKAERTEVVVRHELPVRPLDASGLPEIDRHHPEGQDLAERTQVLPDVPVFAPRHARVHAGLGSRLDQLERRAA